TAEGTAVDETGAPIPPDFFSFSDVFDFKDEETTRDVDSLGDPLQIEIVNDLTIEGQEYFFLGIGNATNDGRPVGITANKITILNDDGIGQFNFDRTAQTVDENVPSGF